VSGRTVLLRRLEGLGRRRGEVESAIDEAVRTARATGVTWSAVGAALGVSAQAAQQRYGRRHHNAAQAERQRPLTTVAPSRRGKARKEKRL
jgi:hypothetical protein